MQTAVTQQDRRCQQQQHARPEDVEEALGGVSVRALMEPVAEDQPPRVKLVDADLAQHFLEVRRQVRDLHPDDLAVEQFAQGQRAAAPVADRHDDLVDAESLGSLLQRTRSAQHLTRIDDVVGLVGPRHEADDLDARIRERNRLGDQLGGRSGPEDQDARVRFGLVAKTRVNPMRNDAGDAQHRQPSELLTVSYVGRHHAENRVRQQQRKHECQHRAGDRTTQRTFPRWPVQARSGVDEKKPRQERQSMRGRNGVVIALPEQRPVGAKKHHRNQRQVSRDLEQDLAVEMVLEQANHSWPAEA